MLGGVVIIRSLLNRMRVRLPSLDVTDAETVNAATAALRSKRQAASLPPPEDEVNEEVLLRAQRRDRVTSYIRDKPQESSRLLKVWLAEE